MIWATALPSELAGIKRRLAALGDTEERLFAVLGHPNVRCLRVTQEVVRFELGSFHEPGTKESIEITLDAGTALARRLEAPV